MNYYNFSRRSISEAVYVRKNPRGDPFVFHKPKSRSEAVLFGMGLGLYWGEGTKADESSIRLGNTDPELLNTFIKFLGIFFKIPRKNLKFGLQIFSDIEEKKALDFWIKKLKIGKEQFNKVVVSRQGSVGTYRKKSEFGVVTIYFSNKKARRVLGDLLPM